MKWTNQELDEFCKQAIELLNKKKGLKLTFMNCWLFSNSCGSNFHIIYLNEFLNASYEITKSGSILEEKKLGIDVAAGLEKVTDVKQKIALRIAYHIFLDCQRNMRNK